MSLNNRFVKAIVSSGLQNSLKLIKCRLYRIAHKVFQKSIKLVYGNCIKTQR